MADDENSWKWDEFVEIGNTIHKMRGQHRRDRAQDALTLAAALRNANFLIRSKERYELYKTLHSKIYIHTLMETLKLFKLLSANILYHCIARLVLMITCLGSLSCQREAEFKPDSFAKLMMKPTKLATSLRRTSMVQLQKILKV
jgi:hypothetical protein